MLSKIFGWWEGATIGTRFTIAKRGRFVGQDENGNEVANFQVAKAFNGVDSDEVGGYARVVAPLRLTVSGLVEGVLLAVFMRDLLALTNDGPSSRAGPGLGPSARRWGCQK